MSLTIHIDTVDWIGGKNVPVTKVVPLGENETLEIIGPTVNLIRNGAIEKCWRVNEKVTVTIFDHGIRQFYTNEARTAVCRSSL